MLPTETERVLGTAKVALQTAAQELIAPDQLPRITLGAEGGTRELDACTGEFTEMITYRDAAVPPLYAAHNNCGGDIILGWQLGTRVQVAGSDTVYEVVDERRTPKGAPVDTLAGIDGELLVQTCFYGEDQMRFLALAPSPA
ncbi:hypothetical protein [Microbacterium sp. Leaf320]|uniref:hypothetical protein n=1 Tax=Microbacterium sp. Leaf320 TaxID=1736334 RepID=UPI000AD44D1B|nr:hypothetical protein [Microbacterium sp. Leaf320]